MFLVCGGLRAAEDPIMGTWKLNLAKSKFDPGPPPKSVIRKHEPHSNGIKVTTDTFEANGEHSHWELTAAFDGKYYPITGSAQRDEVAFKRIDAYTVESTNKDKGKGTTRGIWRVSKDGKTLTATVEGTFSQGQRVNMVRVFDKQ